MPFDTSDGKMCPKCYKLFECSTHLIIKAHHNEIKKIKAKFEEVIKRVDRKLNMENKEKTCLINSILDDYIEVFQEDRDTVLTGIDTSETQFTIKEEEETIFFSTHEKNCETGEKIYQEKFLKKEKIITVKSETEKCHQEAEVEETEIEFEKQKFLSPIPEFLQGERDSGTILKAKIIPTIQLEKTMSNPTLVKESKKKKICRMKRSKSNFEIRNLKKEIQEDKPVKKKKRVSSLDRKKQKNKKKKKINILKPSKKLNIPPEKLKIEREEIVKKKAPPFKRKKLLKKKKSSTKKNQQKENLKYNKQPEQPKKKNSIKRKKRHLKLPNKLENVYRTRKTNFMDVEKFVRKQQKREEKKSVSKNLYKDCYSGSYGRDTENSNKKSMKSMNSISDINLTLKNNLTITMDDSVVHDEVY